MKFLLVIAASTLSALALAAQNAPPPAPGHTPNTLDKARIFRLEEIPARVAPNGSEGRNLFNGTLATGEVVGAHVTLQPAGTVPGAVHTIQHSELIVIVEGTVTFDHDGQTETAGPGSVLYVMPGTMHRLRNTSAAPVQYVVIQVGGDTKK